MKPREALAVLDEFGRMWFASSRDNYWGAVAVVQDLFDLNPWYADRIRAALHAVVFGLVEVHSLCRLVRVSFAKPVASFEDAREFLRLLLEDLTEDFSTEADDEPF